MMRACRSGAAAHVARTLECAVFGGARLKNVSLARAWSLYPLCKPSSPAGVDGRARSFGRRSFVRAIGSTVCSRGISSEELQQRLHDFQEQFAEARMCLDDARESKDTSYFKDDIEEARDAVEKAQTMYSSLLEDLDVKDRHVIDDANSLKVRCLREEYDQLLTEDH
eukprot:CAMPEP_0117522554 /NCGR_PEP_ID=MMETSP0784-20121206/34267_1 /TAXON_ID=39447 /ORGANISM="" /LENGTH=166 /DNA_ID=CAMNT_0005318629 /DNA_START=34 /DNA_END=534 /DNA_ORIENTATION=+